MKKILGIILLTVIATCYAHAQISTCAYYDGYWGKWKLQAEAYTNRSWYSLYGNYSGFIVYLTSVHPSEYCFKFQIDSYNQPSQDDIKYHWKNNIWYEYSGYVEYFVDRWAPTIKKSLQENSFASVSKGEYSQMKTSRATIKIAPYKKRPKVYNIWFEDVGIAIDLGNFYFK